MLREGKGKKEEEKKGLRHDRKVYEDGLGREKRMYRRKGRKKKMGRERRWLERKGDGVSLEREKGQGKCCSSVSFSCHAALRNRIQVLRYGRR